MLAIEEETAEVVRRIFAEYLDGTGDRAIAHGLNLDGIPCPSANRLQQNRHRLADGWQGSIVRAILENPRYTGYAIFGRWTKHETLLDPDDVASGHVARFRRSSRIEWCARESSNSAHWPGLESTSVQRKGGYRYPGWDSVPCHEVLDRVPTTEVGELVDRASSIDIGGPPADDGPYDFFISYDPADQEWASWVAWQLEKKLRLENRTPKLFVRDWNIVPGMHETVGRHLALTESARLIAILTPEYLANRKYSINEWTAVWSDDATGVQRRVIPVRVKECEPPGFLQQIAPIDLFGHDFASATDMLLSGINASLEGHAKPAVPPAFPVALGRKTDAAVGPAFPGPPVLVGEPPTVPPNWFQDRTVEVEDIERHLTDARTGLVMVVGWEGFGKTAMIHRLWERVRNGTSPLRVHGLIYLSAHGFWPVTTNSIIGGLTALFPKHEAEQLEVTVRRPMPWVEKLDVLLTALAKRPVIIAIDGMEELLDDDEDIEETSLREVIDHLVPRAEQGVRLLLVGRHTARAVANRFSGVTHRRNLNEGLPDRDGFALLRAMDEDNSLDLDDVSDHDRSRLHRLTDGSPRALELTYGVLAGGDFSFTRLLEFMGRANSEGMVVHLLDNACERLSGQERRVLQALAVYGRPVSPAAIDHLLRHDLPDLDSRAALRRLRRLRLAQSDGERFSVPANTERDYLIGRLKREVDADASNTPEVLMRRAADYFVGERHADPQSLGDLRPHLIEIELRMRAGDYEAAFERMKSIDDRFLHGWGTSAAVAPSLRTLLRHDSLPRYLEIDAESRLARALMQQEHHQEASELLVHALGLATGPWRGHRRIVLRQQLAEAYLRLGDLRHAAIHSQKAWRAAVLQWRDSDAITALTNLAMCRAREGRFSSALRLFPRAHRMLKLLGTKADRVHRPIMLFGEAWVHSQLGDRYCARSLLQESQQYAAKRGNRRLVGMCMLGEAQLALDEHNLEGAVDLAEKASENGVRNGDRALCRIAMEVLALARLNQDDLDAASRAADIAHRNRGSVLGFGLVGLAAYRRGQDENARIAFYQGYKEARNRYRANERDFQFLDAYGLAACGLALLGEPPYLATALTAYRAAREITTATGAVDRTLMLLEQFEPRADPRILDQVRTAAHGERRGRALQDDD